MKRSTVIWSILSIVLLGIALGLLAARMAQALPIDYEPDTEKPCDEFLSTPEDGETGVPVNQHITIESGNDLLALKYEGVVLSVNGTNIVSDEIFAEQGTYYDADLWDWSWDDGDAKMTFWREIPLHHYTRYTVVFYAVWDDGECTSILDSFSFTTADTASPFFVGPQVWSFSDSTTTGGLSLRVTRQPGTTTYGMMVGGDPFVMVSPDDEFNVERRRQFLRYALSDIPQGKSVWKFWPVTSAGLHGDTTTCWWTYTQITNSRRKGVIGR